MYTTDYHFHHLHTTTTLANTIVTSIIITTNSDDHYLYSDHHHQRSLFSHSTTTTYTFSYCLVDFSSPICFNCYYFIHFKINYTVYFPCLFIKKYFACSPYCFICIIFFSSEIKFTLLLFYINCKNNDSILTKKIFTAIVPKNKDIFKK